MDWAAPSWEAFLRTFIALFVIIDPLGNLPVFYVLTERFTPRQRAATIAMATFASAALLALFGVTGASVLGWLGVSEASFRVAAGLLLLPMVYSLVVEGELPQARSSAGLNPADVALVPLAMPLLAGPGALASVAAYSASVGAVPTLAAAALVLGLTALMFALVGALFRLLGVAVLRLVARIVGLMVFALATELVVSGVAAALRGP